MLAQAGAPSVSNKTEPVSVLKTSVATHAADGIDPVLRVCRTTEPHLSTRRSGSTVAIVTATIGVAFDIRVVQMDVVQGGSPGNALARGRIRAAPERAMARCALSHVVDTIGVMLVRI